MVEKIGVAARDERLTIGKCPTHPESDQVTKVTRGNYGGTEANSFTIYQYTVHRCGEPGCGEYLGWECVGPDHTYQSGLGKCSDPRVFYAMDRADFDAAKSGELFRLGGITAMLVTVSLFFFFGFFSEGMTLSAIATGLAGLLLTLYAYRYMWRKYTANRPMLEDYDCNGRKDTAKKGSDD